LVPGGTHIFRLREKLQVILALKENPHNVAASFGIGVFIGMSPLLGLHTILGLLVASVLKLNRLVTIVGVYVTNPWTIIPIYTFGTWIGMKLLGVDGIVTNINWSDLSIHNVVSELEELLMPFIAGTLFIGAVSSIIGYFLIMYLFKRQRHE
jgi:uncharacterized protein (DUF2062 family)